MSVSNLLSIEVVILQIIVLKPSTCASANKIHSLEKLGNSTNILNLYIHIIRVKDVVQFVVKVRAEAKCVFFALIVKTKISLTGLSRFRVNKCGISRSRKRRNGIMKRLLSNHSLLFIKIKRNR